MAFAVPFPRPHDTESTVLVLVYENRPTKKEIIIDDVDRCSIYDMRAVESLIVGHGYSQSQADKHNRRMYICRWDSPGIAPSAKPFGGWIEGKGQIR